MIESVLLEGEGRNLEYLRERKQAEKNEQT